MKTHLTQPNLINQPIPSNKFPHTIIQTNLIQGTKTHKHTMADKQPPQCRILVMASGSGSNFQALINGVASGAIPHSTISQLIVNRGQAYATTRADEAGIPWAYFNLVSHGFLPKGEKDESVVAAGRARYDAALADRIIKGEGGSGKPDLIVLAGFMHVLSASFLEPLEKEGIRVINLHPALPGKSNPRPSPSSPIPRLPMKT